MVQMLNSTDKFKDNGKDSCKNILCEILYIVSVRITREMLEYWKVGQEGTDENQDCLFFDYLVGWKPTEAINC